MKKQGITEFVLGFTDPDSNDRGYCYSGGELYVLKTCKNIENRIYYGDDAETVVYAEEEAEDDDE